MKKVLVVVNQPPYQSSHALELIEAAMVGAVFDFEVSILFRGEGVWNLLGDQNASPLGRRTVSKLLAALPTYDVSSLFVCTEALNQAALKTDQLVVPAALLSPQEQAGLIARQDAVIGG